MRRRGWDHRVFSSQKAFLFRPSQRRIRIGPLFVPQQFVHNADGETAGKRCSEQRRAERGADADREPVRGREEEGSSDGGHEKSECGEVVDDELVGKASGGDEYGSVTGNEICVRGVVEDCCVRDKYGSPARFKDVIEDVLRLPLLLT